jgi:hypothetical protein
MDMFVRPGQLLSRNRQCLQESRIVVSSINPLWSGKESLVNHCNLRVRKSLVKLSSVMQVQQEFSGQSL